LEPEVLAISMFGGILVGIFTGFPIAFILAGVGLLFGFLAWGSPVLDQMISRTFWVMNNDTFPAIPLFVFMGCVLERSGIIDKLFDNLRLALGPLRGSLALATMLVCTIFAAATGIVGASVTVMGLIALPAMLRHSYDKELATGTILAGGTLGILIPPSIMLIIYGPMAQLSIAKMFAGAIIPGLVLSGLFSSYIGLRCLIQPRMGPALPKEERLISPLRLFGKLSISLFPTAFLVLAVLGSILFGLAAPTEAAAVGAAGALLVGLVYRALNWQNFKDSVYATLRVSSMILIIAVGASIFTGVFLRLGGGPHDYHGDGIVFHLYHGDVPGLGRYIAYLCSHYSSYITFSWLGPTVVRSGRLCNLTDFLLESTVCRFNILFKRSCTSRG